MPDGIQTTKVRIENIDDLKDAHECRAGDKLTEILVGMGRMDEILTAQAACMQEMSSRFEEQSRQIQQVIYSRHECANRTEIETMKTETTELKAEINTLRDEYNQRKGSAYWIEKFVDSAKYILLLVAGAILMAFLQGAHLPA